MKTIPFTDPARYLTGACALNIPAPENTTGDWHFQSVFFLSSSPVQIAGEGEGVLVNTNSLFGTYGIHECGDIVRALGLTIDKEISVYSANHYRAILDLLIVNAQSGCSIEHLMQPEDWLDTPENVNHLVDLLESVEAKLEPCVLETLVMWKKKVLSNNLLLRSNDEKE